MTFVGLVMARKRSSRGRNFVAIPFQTALTLGTLADLTAFITSTVSGFGEDIYVLSVDALWALHTHTAGEGPISVGLAHGDLTVTEIKENLQAEMTDPDDIIAKERSRRPVRKSGIFSGLNTEEALANGEQIRTKVKFSVGDGHNLNAWAFNQSGAALTTGTVIQVIGTIYGRWQR